MRGCLDLMVDKTFMSQNLYYAFLGAQMKRLIEIELSSKQNSLTTIKKDIYYGTHELD